MLIESFKSTLDEVREADILIHVVDISHVGFEEQIQVVNQILNEIGAGNKPIVLVFNKIDLLQEPDASQAEFEQGELYQAPETIAEKIERLKNSYLESDKPKTVFVSAAEKENLDELRGILLDLIKERHYQIFPNWENKAVNDLWKVD
jgi:GTP-binding protein HflX